MIIDIGDHLQYSVFRCELSAREKVELIAALTRELNSREDQALIVDLGPAEGRGGECIESVGRAFSASVRGAVIV